MFYQFAENLTLEETRRVVSEHNKNLGVQAFIEADRGDFVIFNYLLTFDGSWLPFTGDPENDRRAAILRECRGLTFDKASGKVALRKLHKFYNCGQNTESQVDVIDWSQPHVILDKLDGSMLTPYRERDGSFDFHTKMGATDVAQPVNEYVSRNPRYIEFAQRCHEVGKTPMFEWCSRKQRIVIDYPEDRLVLLAVRDLHSGQYTDYDSLQLLGEEFNIPVVGALEGSVTDPLAFLEQARVLEDAEGFVVRFDNGHMVKVKAEEYLRLHNMVDMLQLEKNVLDLVLSGSLDDAKALMTDDSRQRVERYLEAVERGAVVAAGQLGVYVQMAIDDVGQDRKRLAVEWINKVEGSDRALLFQIVNGRNPIEVVLDHVRKNCGTASKVEAIRPYIGGARWQDFRDTNIVLDD